MVTITRHIFINIFQKELFFFSAVKFSMGNEKKKIAFLWYQNLQKLQKKVKKLDCAPLNSK